LGFKTNCISRAKKANQSEKHGQKSTLCAALNETGKWKIETGKRGRQFPFSIFYFPIPSRYKLAGAFSYLKIQIE
jgi:hypothetical protein